MKKIIVRGFALLIVVAAGWGLYSLYRQFQDKKQEIATTSVRQGDVVIRSYARGELRAVRSAMLVAPNLFGTVQITRLAPLGSFAREKDLVVEFDDADVQSRLEERSLEIQQLEEQIKSQEADLSIRDNEDQVELLSARYAVRRAELEVQRNELLSAINAKTNVLNLEEARRRLKQLESDIKSRQEQGKAQLAVLKEKKNQSQVEMNRERQRLMQVKLLAPMSGLVAIKQSRPMGMFFRGMQLPDLREGDQVYPGTPVADVLDLSELEVAAKVNEIDRAGLHEGQDVVIRLDAVADKDFHGTIKNLSGTAAANVYSNDPAKKFDVIFAVDMRELMTGLGAKPEQIRKVLEMAEQNRKRPAAGPSAAQMAIARMNAGGPPGVVQEMPGAAPAAPMGAAPAGAQAGGRSGGGQMMGGPGSQLSEADRTKMREAFQKALAGRSMRDLSDEERKKIFAEVQKALPKGTQMPQFGQRPGGAGIPGAPGGAGAPAAAGGFPAGGPVGPGGPGGMPMMPMPTMAGAFTPKDLENAKLPPPPEENNELDVLLRPGLLADVQIIVEKVPNAIHVPAQAVFEKDGKPVVYVKTGANRFEPRVIKPLKQSESVMVIADGVKPGEVIALTNPERTDKKDKKAGAGKAGGGMPVGGGGSAQGGR